MDIARRDEFIGRWHKYFKNAELPIAFYYADKPGGAEALKSSAGHRCVITDLGLARRGRPICFEADSIGCFGGKKYFGFCSELMPNFEYFLSHGLPGKVEGERYKKSPELVKQLMQEAPEIKAPGKYIIFKRFDFLDEKDEPEAVVFFAKPDVLSGLFTLANFDTPDANGVMAPFAAGCSAIVLHPYLQRNAVNPQGVIGMFDVSARPYVQKDTLTFSVPVKKFWQMADNMEESFLITPSWGKVMKRLEERTDDG